MESELIAGATSGLVGVFTGGWLFKFMLQRFLDRSNGDHDDLIRAMKDIEKAQKDLDHLHQKLRDME